MNSNFLLSNENENEDENEETQVDHQVKRPPNPYILYCQKNREKIQIENPTLTNKEVTIKLASEWQILSEEEKTPYKEEAALLLSSFKMLNPVYTYSKSMKKRSILNEKALSLYETLSNTAKQMKMIEPPRDPSDFLVWLGSHVFLNYVQNSTNLPEKLVNVLIKGPVILQPSPEDIEKMALKLKKSLKKSKNAKQPKINDII